MFFNKEPRLGTSDDNIELLLNELTDKIPRQLNNALVRQEDVETSRNFSEETVQLQDPPSLDQILTIDEGSVKPTSHNVSVLNSACQQVLKEIERQLLVLLKKNRKEQEMVQGFLSSSGKSLNYDNTKKSFLKCAGMPYFKDSHGFQPPLNEDVIKKQRQNKLLPVDFIKGFPVWSSTDAKTLIQSVSNYDITKPDSIDWMKISVTSMQGKYSPSECKSKWFMNLNPSINRSRWSLKEMELLKVLSKEYNYQNWDKIASELGTNRTGLQCCIQYMTNTFPTQGKWTKEEDDTLQKLVEKFRVKDYIPWAKVVWHFENRSAKQCQERYAYHLGDIKKGSFTPEEDFLIVYLASKVKNFGEVAKFLPNRVATQVRSRYEYLVELSMPKFTKEEDELLSKLMTQYPRDWGKISAHFTDRSNIQCRRRWGYLQRKIKLAGDDIQSEDEINEVCSSPPANKDTTMKSNIDAQNYYKLNKNMCPKLKPSLKDKKDKVKKYSGTYGKLLDYHKNCHKFLFGPKPRVSLNPEDQEKLVKKMMVTMKTLSVSHTGPLNGFNMDTLSNNCEFEREDLDVLTRLSCSETGGFEVSKKIIPPNYMTVVGLRSLTLNWVKIKNLCNFHKQRESSAAKEAEDRLLCSDAKKLFKSRLKTLFAFPLILSNITPCQSRSVKKSKVRKIVKPWSKQRRKEHAKLMNAAYKEKLKALGEKLGNSKGGELSQNDDSSSATCSKYKSQTKCLARKSEIKEGSDMNGGEPSRKRARSCRITTEESTC